MESTYRDRNKLLQVKEKAETKVNQYVSLRLITKSEILVSSVILSNLIFKIIDKQFILHINN